MNRTTIALAVSLLAGLPGAALAQAGHDAHHLATPPAQVEQTPAPTPPAGRMSAMQGMMPEQCRAMMQAMTPECVGAMQQMMQGGMMQGMTTPGRPRRTNAFQISRGPMSRRWTRCTRR